MNDGIDVRRLGPGDAAGYRALMDLFARVFDDPETYAAAPPDADYVAGRLADRTLILLTALCNGRVAGGLAAYELKKFERARSEVYIYDLAVDPEHRRRGLARALIGRTQQIARDCGAWVVFVQADIADAPARALYRSLGREERVLHYDISVASPAVP